MQSQILKLILRTYLPTIEIRKTGISFNLLVYSLDHRASTSIISKGNFLAVTLLKCFGGDS